MNAPEAILPVIGLWFATPMKQRLIEAVGSFPMLFVYGTQGSGKSSLISEIFWPLFGVDAAEPYSATETDFALLKLLSSSTTVPAFIDEYKPFDMAKGRRAMLHRCIRRLYKGEVEERGRADQKLNTYPLETPLCIAGESRPSEAAVVERLVPANLKKVELEEHPEYQQAFVRLRAMDLALFAPRYIQFCLGRELGPDLEAAQALTDMLLHGGTVPIRIVHKVTTMILGLRLFSEFAATFGATPLPHDHGARQATAAVLADLVEPDGAVQNALDHFLQMLAVMAVQGDVAYRKHYIVKDGTLFFRLNSCYDSFRKHCRAINYEGEVVDERSLARLMRECHARDGYVTVVSTGVEWLAVGKRQRAWGIDLARASFLSPDDFGEEAEQAPARHWVS